MQKISFRLLAAAAPWLIATQLAAQSLTLPPAGGNQRSTVTQSMGLVTVGVEYNSVDVHSPTGEDRTGKIWGQLVPYGMVDLGYNGGKKSPWRAGSNENTVFTASHDVLIEGKPLAAGRYGLHMIPGEQEWTVIFSKRNDAWGSYFYDESEDALRVTVRSVPAEYSEWLDFQFADRQLETCRLDLRWEKLRVPFTVRVPDTVGLYVASIQNELKGSSAWQWQDYDAAAQFVLQRDPEGKHMEQALAWTERSVTPLWGGDRNFTTLSTRAQVLERLQRPEAAAARQEALQAAASPIQIHNYGRSLQGQQKMQEALEVFQLNAKRFPGVWPVEVGLMRGFAGIGKNAEAIAHGKKALATAPDEASRQNVQNLLNRLEKGEPLG